MHYRLIALDLDGTLLGSEKQISPRTRSALLAAREQGLMPVVATGRTPQSAHRFSLLIGGGPVICCNGAGVLDQEGGYIVRKGIPPVPLLRALELAQREKILAECYTPRGIYMDKPFAQAQAYVRWLKGKGGGLGTVWSLIAMWRINHMIPVRNLVRWASRPGQVPVLKLMLFGEVAHLAEVAAHFNREIPGLELSSSGHGNLEITAAGVSKGTALELLGSRLKIPRQAMIAVGDSANDLSMLRYAGLGVAMGNASDQVKAEANQVTASCDEEGVAILVESMLGLS